MSWSKIQDHHHRGNVGQINSVSPSTWLDKLTNSKDRERYEICWDPQSAGREPHAFFGTPFCEMTIQELSGAQVQPNFLSQKIQETDCAKGLNRIGLAKYETAIE